MGPAFDDPALVEHEHLVDGVESGQSVGDQQDRLLRGGIEHVGHDRVGGRRVEVLARLIEHQHRELGDQRTGRGEPLTLAPGHPIAKLAHLRPQTVRQRLSPVEQPDAGQRSIDLLLGRAVVGDAEVVLQSGVEDVRVLRHQADHPPAVVTAELAELYAAERHRPRLVGQEPQQHIGEGRLARAAATHESHPPAGREVQVYAVQDPGALVAVAATQSPHLHPGRAGRDRRGLHWIDHHRFHLQHIARPPE